MKEMNSAVRFLFFSPKREPLMTISCSYAFSGINLIAKGVINKVSTSPCNNSSLFIVLGVVFLLMVPITFWDKREVNRGVRYAFFACVLHFLTCLYLILVWSFSWIAVYVCEVIVYSGIAFLKGKFCTSKKKGK